MTDAPAKRTRTADDEFDPEFVGAHSGADGSCTTVVSTDPIEFCGDDGTHTLVYKDQNGLHERAFCDEHGEPENVTDWRREWSADVDDDRLIENGDESDSAAESDPDVETDSSDETDDPDDDTDDTPTSDVQVASETPLEEVADGWNGIGDGTIDKLTRNGFETLGDLREATVGDITDLHQIGSKMATKLKDLAKSTDIESDDASEIEDEPEDETEVEDADRDDADTAFDVTEWWESISTTKRDRFADILRIVDEGGIQTQPEIAEQTEYTKSSLSNYLSDTDGLGACVAKVDGTYQLTSNGHKVLSKIDAEAEAETASLDSDEAEEVDESASLSDAISDASETVTDGGAAATPSASNVVDVDVPGAGRIDESDDSGGDEPPYLPDDVSARDVKELAAENRYLADVADELGIETEEARALTFSLDVYEQLREGSAFNPSGDRR